MADSLVLKGVKDVKKHTGTEMLRLNPKGGSDVFSLKRWWIGSGVSTVYSTCTVFDVTTAAGTVKLALDTNASSIVRIEHDGSFNFDFIGTRDLSRAALFTDAWELIEHYVFPSISGGKVMTVTPSNPGSRPNAGPPAISIGTVSVTGDNTAQDGDAKTYSVGVSGGTAGNLSYAWSMSGNGSIDGSSTGATVVIALEAGTAIITCAVTSSDAGVTNSPQSADITVTVSA